MTNRTFLYFAVCTVNLAALTAGICVSWTSPILPKLDGYFEDTLTEKEESLIGSLLPISAVISPFFAGYSADKIGRKKTLILFFLLTISAFIIAAFATNVMHFYLTRVLFGISCGVIFMILPIYIAEISDDEVRGSLGSFMQIFTSSGSLFANVVGSYTSIFLFNILCSLVPTCFILIFSFIPESPFYHASKNNHLEAEKSLTKFRGMSRDYVQSELMEIRKNVEDSMQNKGSITDLVKSRGNIKALYLSMGLILFQQFAGINAIQFYTQDIFKASNMSMITPITSSIIIGTIQTVSSFIAPVLADRLGRRILMIFSAIGSGLSLMTLGYYFYCLESDKDISGVFALVPVISLIVYIITFCSGYGSVPWAVVGELFPTNVKAIASSCIVSFCWFLCFVTTNYFKTLVAYVGSSYTFWLFGVFALSGGLFVYILLPETKGKSLHEIQDILNGNKTNKDSTF